MSRSGNCWDKAVAEPLVSGLKSELVRKRIFTTRDETRSEMCGVGSVCVSTQTETQNAKAFYTQRSEGFIANTLTHIVNGIYSQADIGNASSYSSKQVA